MKDCLGSILHEGDIVAFSFRNHATNLSQHFGIILDYEKDKCLLAVVDPGTIGGHDVYLYTKYKSILPEKLFLIPDKKVTDDMLVVLEDEYQDYLLYKELAVMA